MRQYLRGGVRKAARGARVTTTCDGKRAAGGNAGPTLYRREGERPPVAVFAPFSFDRTFEDNESRADAPSGRLKEGASHRTFGKE